MRSLSLVVVAAFVGAVRCRAPGAGRETVRRGLAEEAVADLQKATAANDMLQALPVISPGGLKQIADEGVTGLLMVLAFSDPDDAMPGGPKPTKAELDAKRKQYKQAVDLATQTLKPYGLDALIGKPVLAEDTQKSLNAALDKADNAALDHVALWRDGEDGADARHETESQAGASGQDSAP